MSDMKTVPTGASVEAFIDAVDNDGRREDACVMLELMSRATGTAPKMWGDSLIGYGQYEYSRADGSQHRFFVSGFSPRKANMVVYLMSGVAQYADRLDKMGKYKNSSSCLYLGRIKNLDLSILEAVIKDDIEKMKSRYKVTF